MATNKTYNGHKNWNHWNVSLWINNDEGLYREALLCVENHPTKNKAAEAMLKVLRNLGKDQTPDGAPYSVTTIRAAMRGM